MVRSPWDTQYDMHNTKLVLVRFRIGGSLRFLSHAETVRFFERACVRAGIEMQYSQGFNPRPRLSLPLPRPVGVESDEELLCLRINKSTSAQEHKSTSAQEHKSTSDLCTSVKTRLAEQLPKNFKLLSIEVIKAKCAPQPRLATYVLAVRPEFVDDRLRATIKRLLASESLNVQRWKDTRHKTPDSRHKTPDTRPKTVDVRDFLESIELDEDDIVVECKISSAGSIRVDEILKLLELDVEKLAAPIRRTNVQWQVSE